ncbi:hypothetical protein Thimo_2984 [Thioflavicoccus mobilis 8321]|uniref:Uncharacterized protein n=1 Tax=Thioflavicoccus mobilis 8321 TaxID=765912 RepID=L0H1Z7_9GAMM|nr:hypothetical protein [Thioflavicoccus mobilis]AGA91675.1 hypothetical protein Thimo_2984 [Thioflavicoccus mobilis 8321]
MAAETERHQTREHQAREEDEGGVADPLPEEAASMLLSPAPGDLFDEAWVGGDERIEIDAMVG